MQDKIFVTTEYDFREDLKAMLNTEKYEVLEQFEHPNEIDGDKEYTIVVATDNKEKGIPKITELGFDYNIPLLVSDK